MTNTIKIKFWLFVFAFVFSALAVSHISIQSPSAGINYNVGDTLHFHWTSLDNTVGPGCQIMISFDNGANFYPWNYENEYSPASTGWGCFDWKITDTLYTEITIKGRTSPIKKSTVSNQVIVRISDYYNKISESQIYSSGVFSISPAAGIIEKPWMRNDSPFVYITSFSVIGANLFAGTLGNGIFLSSDNGATWRPVNTGLTDEYVISLIANGTELFAGTSGGGIFLSKDYGENWTPINAGLSSTYIITLCAQENNLFAATNSGGVFLSRDSGTSWTSANAGLSTMNIVTLCAQGTNLFAGTKNDGVFLYRGGGTSWTPINTGLTSNYITAMCTMGSDLFIGTYTGEVFLSKDSGSNWIQVSTGTGSGCITKLCTKGSNLFAGTDSGGVYLSRDQGIIWTSVNYGLTNINIKTIEVNGTKVFVGTDHGIWQRSLTDIVSIEKYPNLLSNQFFFFQSYPNPFNPSTTLIFNTGQIGQGNISIYSITGSQIISKKVIGNEKFIWNASGQPSGIYLCKLSVGDKVVTQRLILAR